MLALDVEKAWHMTYLILLNRRTGVSMIFLVHYHVRISHHVTFLSYTYFRPGWSFLFRFTRRCSVKGIIEGFGYQPRTGPMVLFQYENIMKELVAHSQHESCTSSILCTPC
jgi:hypothetical protein